MSNTIAKTEPKLDKPGAGLPFFEWAYAKGDAMADALDYVPLDSKQKSAVKEIWTAIK